MLCPIARTKSTTSICPPENLLHKFLNLIWRFAYVVTFFFLITRPSLIWPNFVLSEATSCCMFLISFHTDWCFAPTRFWNPVVPILRTGYLSGLHLLVLWSEHSTALEETVEEYSSDGVGVCRPCSRLRLDEMCRWHMSSWSNQLAPPHLRTRNIYIPVWMKIRGVCGTLPRRVYKNGILLLTPIPARSQFTG